MVKSNFKLRCDTQFERDFRPLKAGEGKSLVVSKSVVTNRKVYECDDVFCSLQVWNDQPNHALETTRVDIVNSHSKAKSLR